MTKAMMSLWPYLLVALVMYIGLIVLLFKLNKRMIQKTSLRFRRICGVTEPEIPLVIVSNLGDGFLEFFEKRSREVAENLKEVYDVEQRRLGGDGPVFPLREVYISLSYQPSGERGKLLVDGRGNSFHAQDKKGMIRDVVAYCVRGEGLVGWHVDAYAI
jgi:hypothetical protein